jgi:hypothetical protein
LELAVANLPSSPTPQLHAQQTPQTTISPLVTSFQHPEKSRAKDHSSGEYFIFPLFQLFN